MNRKVFWILLPCIAAALIASGIVYYITENESAGITLGVFFCIFLCFSILSAFLDNIKKKQWISVCMIPVLAIALFVILGFIVNLFIQMDNKQKEIDAVSLRIEAEEDEDECWRLLTEEKWPLIDEKIELSFKFRFLNITLFLPMILMGIPEIYYRNKKSKNQTENNQTDGKQLKESLLTEINELETKTESEPQVRVITAE